MFVLARVSPNLDATFADDVQVLPSKQNLVLPSFKDGRNTSAPWQTAADRAGRWYPRLVLL